MATVKMVDTLVKVMREQDKVVLKELGHAQYFMPPESFDREYLMLDFDVILPRGTDVSGSIPLDLKHINGRVWKYVEVSRRTINKLIYTDRVWNRDDVECCNGYVITKKFPRHWLRENSQGVSEVFVKSGFLWLTETVQYRLKEGMYLERFFKNAERYLYEVSRGKPMFFKRNYNTATYSCDSPRDCLRNPKTGDSFVVHASPVDSGEYRVIADSETHVRVSWVCESVCKTETFDMCTDEFYEMLLQKVRLFPQDSIVCTPGDDKAGAYVHRGGTVEN